MQSPKQRRNAEIQRQVRVFAATIPNQDALNQALARVSEPAQRQAIFDIAKPHLRFEAVYPTGEELLHLVVRGN